MMESTGSALVHRIVPAPIVASERRAIGERALLRGLEQNLVHGFAQKRLAEFAAGRDCARRALRSLGAGENVIPRRANGAPEWPLGYVGSITHTIGFCAAVAASATHYASVGIDAERTERLTPDLFDEVFVARERAALAALSAADRARSAIVMFSAKEAFYKCQAPLTNLWIDFTDVAIDLTFTTTNDGSFCVIPISAATQERFGMASLRGRFAFEQSLVVTAIVAPAVGRTW